MRGEIKTQAPATIGKQIGKWSYKHRALLAGQIYLASSAKLTPRWLPLAGYLCPVLHLASLRAGGLDRQSSPARSGIALPSQFVYQRSVAHFFAYLSHRSPATRG